jgi:NAD(P)-dependent dehydrogenase (short-subunit alcohol dehydrogenase family)
MLGIDTVLNVFRGERRSDKAKAVVTGAGSGIGRSFALELARRGGEIICADISVERAVTPCSATSPTAPPSSCWPSRHRRSSAVHRRW